MIDNKKLPKITSTFLIITNQCNLACRYCFVHQNKENMTYETALDAVNFLIRNSEIQNDTPSINFFGGEPLLRWNEIIVPLTKYIRDNYKKPFNLSMTSNCILMTEEKLEFMKENNIGLLFSIDGDKITQDYNRPLHNDKSSFDILEPKIPIILKYYPNMTFRATIYEDTCQYTFKNMKFAVENGFNNMFFIPNVFNDWSDSNKAILKQQIKMFGDYFIENARNGKIIRLNNFDTEMFKIRRINDSIKNNTYRIGQNNAGYGKCGLGSSKFASISTNGDLYGCQELVTNKDNGNFFYIGNIYTGVDEKSRYSLVEKYLRTEVNGLNCSTCKLDSICDGGCVANNYIINNDINKMPVMYCFWIQTLLDECIRVANVLGNEENLLFRDKYFSANARR